MEDLELFSLLRNDPPLPPWLAFPSLEPTNIGWRMGGGEEHIYKLFVYYRYCSTDERQEYKRRYPEPAGWSGWYDDHGLQFDGVDIFEIPEETLLRSCLSPDRKALVIIGRREDGLFRVRAYRRANDSFSAREYWAEVSSPSLFESEPEALDLADSLLGVVSEE